MADKLLRLAERLTAAKIEYNQLLIDYRNFDLQLEKVPGLQDAVFRFEELCKEVEALPLLKKEEDSIPHPNYPSLLQNRAKKRGFSHLGAPPDGLILVFCRLKESSLY